MSLLVHLAVAADIDIAFRWNVLSVVLASELFHCHLLGACVAAVFFLC